MSDCLRRPRVSIVQYDASGRYVVTESETFFSEAVWNGGSYYSQNAAEPSHVYILNDDGDANTFHRFDSETMQINSAEVPYHVGQVGCLAVAGDTMLVVGGIPPQRHPRCARPPNVPHRRSHVADCQ